LILGDIGPALVDAIRQCEYTVVATDVDSLWDTLGWTRAIVVVAAGGDLQVLLEAVDRLSNRSSPTGVVLVGDDIPSALTSRVDPSDVHSNANRTEPLIDSIARWAGRLAEIPGVVRVGDYQVDLDIGQIEGPGRIESIGGKGLRVLRALAGRPSGYTLRELKRLVWGNAEDNTVQQAVSRLRKKIDPGGSFVVGNGQDAPYRLRLPDRPRGSAPSGSASSQDGRTRVFYLRCQPSGADAIVAKGLLRELKARGHQIRVRWCVAEERRETEDERDVITQDELLDWAPDAIICEAGFGYRLSLELIEELQGRGAIAIFIVPFHEYKSGASHAVYRRYLKSRWLEPYTWSEPMDLTPVGTPLSMPSKTDVPVVHYRDVKTPPTCRRQIGGSVSGIVLPALEHLVHYNPLGDDRLWQGVRSVGMVRPVPFHAGSGRPLLVAGNDAFVDAPGERFDRERDPIVGVLIDRPPLLEAVFLTSLGHDGPGQDRGDAVAYVANLLEVMVDYRALTSGTD